MEVVIEARDQDISFAAVLSVVKFLRSNQWEARSFPGKRGEIPSDAIKISVGFKPSPYFADPEIKGILDDAEQFRKQFEDEAIERGIKLRQPK